MRRTRHDAQRPRRRRAPRSRGTGSSRRGELRRRNRQRRPRRGGPSGRRLLESPFRWLSLADLLARADVVSLHCRLTRETRHLIDDASLAAIRTGAYLVNTARGPIVDERALARADQTRGQLAGAALDVYEREPKVEEELLGLERVVFTPHLEARQGLGVTRWGCSAWMRSSPRCSRRACREAPSTPRRGLACRVEQSFRVEDAPPARI